MSDRKNFVSRSFDALTNTVGDIISAVSSRDVLEKPFTYYRSASHRIVGVVDLPDGSHAGYTHAAPAGRQSPFKWNDSEVVATAPLSARHSFR